MPVFELVTAALADLEEFEKECAITEWGPGSVNMIPLICEFMKKVGGCTEKGKLFWRAEEKQLVSLLIKAWFQESSSRHINALGKKTSIMVGSPGVGKSVLTCMLAFYLVMKRRKSVFLYRKKSGTGLNNYCLLYLKHGGGRIEYFYDANCKEQSATEIYDELVRQHEGIEKPWLLLDGFGWSDLPAFSDRIKLLVTSQQVRLKSSDFEHAFCCLLPSWKIHDIFQIGRTICEFEDEEIRRRFYFSGSSVREFLRPKALLQLAIDRAVACVGDVSELFSRNVESWGNESDLLRRTFIKPAPRYEALDEQDADRNEFLPLISRFYWEHVMDSEYAAMALSSGFPSESLRQIYRWAHDIGHASLAGSSFRLYLHALACNSKLAIVAGNYNKGGGQASEFVPVPMVKLTLLEGGVRCSGTNDQYEECLKKWRDNDSAAYWYPACSNIGSIDAIVKLKTDHGMNQVAYVQMTMCT